MGAPSPTTQFAVKVELFAGICSITWGIELVSLSLGARVFQGDATWCTSNHINVGG